MQVCYFWLVGLGFFASLCPCRIIWPNTGGYDEKGPINLKSIVWAGADAELGPCSSLCKLTELLALGAHFLKLTPWVHMWSVIVYSSLVAETTPQHLSLQELFGQNLSVCQKLQAFSVQATVTIVLSAYFCLPFPPSLWSRALLTRRGGGVCFRDMPAATAPSSTKAQHNPTRDSGNCSTNLRGLLKVTQ